MGINWDFLGEKYPATIAPRPVVYDPFPLKAPRGTTAVCPTLDPFVNQQMEQGLASKLYGRNYRCPTYDSRKASWWWVDSSGRQTITFNSPLFVK